MRTEKREWICACRGKSLCIGVTGKDKRRGSAGLFCSQFGKITVDFSFLGKVQYEARDLVRLAESHRPFDLCLSLALFAVLLSFHISSILATKGFFGVSPPVAVSSAPLTLRYSPASSLFVFRRNSGLDSPSPVLVTKVTSFASSLVSEELQ